MPTVLVEGKPEFLDGRDDDLVRIVVGLKTTDKLRGIGVFLNAILLKPIELVARLAVKVLAVNDKKTLLDVLIGLE